MKKIKNVLLLICAVLTVANSFSIFFLHNGKSEDISCNETAESSDEADVGTNVYYLNSYKSLEVLDCPFCGGNVKILPINESFYIRCESCRVETGSFDDAVELSEYWNKAKR